MGAGAAGPSGVPARQAQHSAAGSATTRPRSVAGSPAPGGMCRAEPAETHGTALLPTATWSKAVWGLCWAVNTPGIILQ